jgi:GNAT superfamily N-acetyltransferase
VVHVGYRFFDEAQLPGGFVADVFIRNWTAILRRGQGIFLGGFSDKGEFVGGLGGVLCPDLNNGQLIAVECFWYVAPESRGAGIRLLKAYEKWCAEQGVKRIAMIHLTHVHPGSMRRLYERMGYREVEVNYIKELQNVSD